MIAFAAIARQWRAALLGLLLLLVASLIALVAMHERQPLDKLPLQGVASDLLADDGLSLYPVDASVEPAFSADAAHQDAARRFGGTGSVREIVPARVVQSSLVPVGNQVADGGAKPSVDQLAWVVNYEPKSAGAPWIGWTGEGNPPYQPPKYHLVFLDANTGEFIFSVSH
jgi:hypothetical protein